MLFLAGECGRGGGVWWAWRWCWRQWLGVVAGAAVTAATVVHGAVALWGGGGWMLAEFGCRRLCGTGRFPAWGHADGGGGGSGCCLAGVDPLSPACRRGGGSRWWRWRRRVLFVGGAVGRQVRGSGGVAGGMLRGGFVGRVICVGGMFCVGSAGRCTGVGTVFFFTVQGGGHRRTAKDIRRARHRPMSGGSESWWRGRGAQRGDAHCKQTAPSVTPPLTRGQELVCPGLSGSPASCCKLQADGWVAHYFSFSPPLCRPSSPPPHLTHTRGAPCPHPRTPTTVEGRWGLSAPESAPLPPPQPPDAPSLPTIETRCDSWQIDDSSTK